MQPLNVAIFYPFKLNLAMENMQKIKIPPLGTRNIHEIVSNEMLAYALKNSHKC